MQTVRRVDQAIFARRLATPTRPLQYIYAMRVRALGGDDVVKFILLIVLNPLFRQCFKDACLPVSHRRSQNRVSHHHILG